MGYITIRKNEQDLMNTDKLAYALAEAIVAKMVHNRREVTKSINGSVKVVRNAARSTDVDTWENMDLGVFNHHILNKDKIDGMVEGFTYSFSDINGVVEEHTISNTFHFTTYASLWLVTGLYLCGSRNITTTDLFHSIWFHGCYGEKFTLSLTDQMRCHLVAQIEEYLATMLVSRKFLKDPHIMEAEYNKMMMITQTL